MKNLYFFLAVLLSCQIVKAQNGNENYHRSSNPADHPENSTGNSGTGGNINVVYHRCDWTIDPSTSKNIAGTVTTYFKTITSNVATITMDLNSTSFNNASLIVKYHGTTCTRTCASNILTITLPSTIVANNTFDSISVAYSGVPPAVSGQAEGFQRKQDGAGNWYIYTLSESYEDRDWWPCKADMQDKIDSMDINITVPSAYWAAANGTLIDSAVNGANRTLKFKHRYPIASYLVAIGVAKYNRYYRGTVPIGGKNVPVVYYLFPDVTGTTLTNSLAALDVSKQELALYSAKYGDYGFVNEKHGYYEFGWNGGMEHQTFSAMGAGTLTDWSVIAHELAHQWWGDKVSFGTWNHLWLAEGFARYSEVLTAENINVGETALTHITSIKSTARSTNSTPILLSSSSIANSNAVWTTNNNNAIYERGCMVVSMLRATLGDNAFFKACQSYQTDPLLAYKSATTTDLQHHMEGQSFQDMTSFFKAWIDSSGTPSYTGQYYTTGKFIQFKFNQTRTGTGTLAASFFPMPIVIKIGNAAGTYDTTVVVYHYSPTSLGYAGNGIGPAGKNVISYNLSFVPATVSFDPGNVTMATGTMTLTGTVLADEVQDLKAQKSTNGNEVDLTVINTETIKKVTLYKSANGIDFTLAGEMNANGIAGNRLSYHFTDNNPYAPVSFYRATISTATKSLVSNIVKIQSNATIKKITVSPNPVSDMVAVNFNNDNKENTIIKVTAIDGKKAFESTTTNNFMHFDVSYLPAGTYTVQIIQGGKISESAMFLVSR